MMKPDIIVSWPRNTDYPLWREMIHKERTRFNEVIIVFTETHYGDDYREFVKKAMFQDHVLFLQAPPPRENEDWRDLAVNFGLMQSIHSEWIWFTEEDFFPKEGFWEEVEELSKVENNGSIMVKDGDRMHPCCLFLKRETLNKTRRFFGIKPDKADHFYAIHDDLKNLFTKDNIYMGIISQDKYEHMAGLSHNMRLLWEGNQPNHAVEQFSNYLLKCLKVSVPIDDRFFTMVNEYFQDNPPVLREN